MFEHKYDLAEQILQKNIIKNTNKSDLIVTLISSYIRDAKNILCYFH